MIVDEEALAIQLQEELTARFTSHGPAIRVERKGCGREWYCIVGAWRPLSGLPAALTPDIAALLARLAEQDIT